MRLFLDSQDYFLSQLRGKFKFYGLADSNRKFQLYEELKARDYLKFLKWLRKRISNIDKLLITLEGME